MEVKRGDIWFCDIPETMENVQKGLRPVLIISNNKANYYSTIITCCPISTKSKNMVLHVPIMIDQQSWVLCEQLLTVNKKNLTKFKCKVSSEVMMQVEKAIDIQLQRVNDKKENDIESYQSALRQAKSIQFLEEFILQHGESLEILNSLYIQVQELQSYCKIHNIPVNRIYQSRLKAPWNKKEVG